MCMTDCKPEAQQRRRSKDPFLSSVFPDFARTCDVRDAAAAEPGMLGILVGVFPMVPAAHAFLMVRSLRLHPQSRHVRVGGRIGRSLLIAVHPCIGGDE